MMKNQLAGLMKQAQAMQDNMKKAQEEIAKLEIEGQAGAGLVKVFPVAAAGGPAYVGFLKGPMPEMPLWVSGGVELDQVAAYLNLGVKAVGLTSALFPADALERSDLDAIRELARRAAAVTGSTAKF